MSFSLKVVIYNIFKGFDTNRNQLVSGMIPIRNGAWLDIGCGEGELFNLRRDFTGFAVGAELDGPSLLAAKKRGFRDRGFIRIDLEHPLPFRDGSLNLITSSSVFNYIDRVPEAFEDVHRALKPGGWFIFEVPNFAAFYRRYDAFMGRIPSTSGYMTRFRGGVKTQYTARMIEEELIGGLNRKLGGGRGFEIRDRKTVGIFSRFRDVVWPTLLASEFAYALEKRK